MKLVPIGTNQTELEMPGGVTVFYSYQTPVAAFVPGRGALVTTKHWSNTTSKHVNATVKRWGATRVDVEQKEIEAIANGGK